MFVCLLSRPIKMEHLPILTFAQLWSTSKVSHFLCPNNWSWGLLLHQYYHYTSLCLYFRALFRDFRLYRPKSNSSRHFLFFILTSNALSPHSMCFLHLGLRFKTHFGSSQIFVTSCLYYFYGTRLLFSPTLTYSDPLRPGQTEGVFEFFPLQNAFFFCNVQLNPRLP